MKGVAAGLVASSALLLLAALAPAGAAGIPAGATAATLSGPTLPAAFGIADRGLAWSGTHAYVFGDGSDRIVDFDPAAGTATVLPVHLPSWRQFTPAAWLGGKAYLVGGYGPSSPSYLDTILVFDPAGGGSVTVSPVVLPYKVLGSTVVSTGSKIYAFGGDALAGTTDGIIEFDPAAGTAVQLALHLPGPLRDASGVWDGSAAYLFGGNHGTGSPATFQGSQVVRFVPPSGLTPASVTILPATLPDELLDPSAVWDGSKAFILGGYSMQLNPNHASAWIGTFDPAAGSVAAWSASLPYGLMAAPAFFDTAKACAYLVGGYDDLASRTDVVAFGDSACFPAATDSDGDGILDGADDCPNVSNPMQQDQDGDGLGDACDPDLDGDGVANLADDCPFATNPGQADLDRDGLGDACDADRDGDGVDDAADDCPLVADAAQSDLDGDRVGDACDGDIDGDGIANLADDCPRVANPGQADWDANGVGDACDRAPAPAPPRLPTTPYRWPRLEPPPMAVQSPPQAMARAKSTCGSWTVAFDGWASMDPDGAVTAWSWDFGDGAQTRGPEVRHTFAGAGHYSVTLAVSDDQGGRSTAVLDVDLQACTSGTPTLAAT